MSSHRRPPTRKSGIDRIETQIRAPMKTSARICSTDGTSSLSRDLSSRTQEQAIIFHSPQLRGHSRTLAQASAPRLDTCLNRRILRTGENSMKAAVLLTVALGVVASMALATMALGANGLDGKECPKKE